MGKRRERGGVALPEIALARGCEPMGSAGVRCGGGGEQRAVLGSWAVPGGRARLQEQPLCVQAGWHTPSVSHRRASAILEMSQSSRWQLPGVKRALCVSVCVAVEEPRLEPLQSWRGMDGGPQRAV